MYCIKKKLLAIIIVVSIAFYLVIAFNNSITWRNLSLKTKATDNFCQVNGLYDLPEENSDLKQIINNKCAGNADKPQWNGKRRGNGAACYTATRVCGKIPGCVDRFCVVGINKDTPCINEPVNLEKCINAHAVTEAQLAGNECVYGGAILSDYSKPYSYNPTDFCVKDVSGKYLGYRCQNDGKTLTGGLMASATKDNYCEQIFQLKFVCMYAGQVVNAVSTPYFYDANPTSYKCIHDKDGHNVGVRCITDASGEIIANYNMEDKENCPLSASPVQQITAIPQPQTTSAPAQPTSIQVAPAQPAQQLNCDEDAFKASNYNCGIEGWYVGKCDKADSTSYWKCGCDAGSGLSYPILYKVATCP